VLFFDAIFEESIALK